MNVTVDDVIFWGGPERIYVKYKSREPIARALSDLYIGFLPVKTWLLKARDTAFYAIKNVKIPTIVVIIILMSRIHFKIRSV